MGGAELGEGAGGAQGRSERTQEFGDWYEMYDKAIDSVFYVNDRFNKISGKPFS